MCFQTLCCLWETTTPLQNQAWATKLSAVWDATTVVDKYGITDRPVQFHWHILSGHTDPNHERNSQTFLGYTEASDLDGRILFISMLNDFKYRIKINEQRCSANATEVTEYVNQFELGRWCVCGFGQEKYGIARARTNQTELEMTSPGTRH